MHSRNFWVAFLTFSLTSFTAHGAPAGPQQQQCSTLSISTIIHTVTVIAQASATATTKPGSNNTNQNGNNGNGGIQGSKNDRNSSVGDNRNGNNNGNKGGNNVNIISNNGKSGVKNGNNGGNNGTTGVKNGNNGANNGTTGVKNGNNGTSVNNSGKNANAGGNASNPQTSLTLDPRVIAKGFANNGQDVPVAGQVASLTSTNNFINFCLTVNLPLTNGQQIKTGSCNPAPMGVIPSSANMPSSKFVNPPNFGTIKANTAFTVQMSISNMQTGFFVNAAQNYFAAPQFLNKQGQIQGHSHVVIEQLSSLVQTTVTDPTKFVFFKGLNNAAQNGILTADVTNGLPAGSYKISSINTAANHQPVLVPIAQHGALDDSIYFTVTADGKPASGAIGAGNATTTAIVSATPTSVNGTQSASATLSVSGAAATTTKGGKGAGSGNSTASGASTASGKASSPGSSVTKGAPTSTSTPAAQGNAHPPVSPTAKAGATV